MKTPSVIECYKTRAKDRKTFTKLEKDLARIEKEMEEVATRLNLADRISFVTKGVPVYEGSGGIWGVENFRRGFLYKNAQNNRTWGVRVTDNLGKETWYGAGFATYKQVRQIALNYVVTGKHLPENQRRY